MTIQNQLVRQRVMDVVNREQIPLTVEHVRTSADLVNWESTKCILLELVLEGKIGGLRGGNGWLFFNKDVISLQQLRPPSPH